PKRTVATRRASGVSNRISCRGDALGTSSSNAVRSSGDISLRMAATCSCAMQCNNDCCASTSRYSKTSAARAAGKTRKMMTRSSSGISTMTSATSAGGHSLNNSRKPAKSRASIRLRTSGMRILPTIRRECDISICVLAFARPESGANIFDAAALSDLDQQLDFIEGEDSLEGVVILSAKKSIFIAGADLKTLLHQAQTGEMRAFIAEGQRIFNRLAALKIPTCAAIHGACAGGGYEITLACDWRIASDDPTTRIGLPETTLGLIPAWGGCTRLPRLIGAEK